MPSSKDLSALSFGYGRLHRGVATAAAHLFADSGGGSSTVSSGLYASASLEVAVVKVSADTLSVGDSSFLISAVDVPFVGDNVSEPLDNLFRVVNDLDEEIYDSGGTIIRVASIGGASVGGGFVASNVTLNFSATIPAGVTYRVYYGIRDTLGSLRPDAFTYPAIRRSPQIEKEVQDLFKALQDDAGVPVWDDTWISSIGSLSRAGLDERYRRKSGAVTGNLDTAGDGAVITRDGQSPTTEATYATQDYNNNYKDPFWAQWKTQIPGTISSYAFDGREDGGSGFVALTNRRTINTANDRGRPALSAAAFWTLMERHNNQSTLGGSDTRTRIDPTNTTATALNPDAGTSDDDRSTIELGTNDYFYNLAGKSEVAVGYDLLKISYPGKPDEAYVITEIDPGLLGNTKRARLRTLGGGRPNFPSGVTTSGISFQLLKTLFHQGGGAGVWQGELGATQFPLLDNFTVAVPPPVTDTPSAEVIKSPPAFFAAATSAASYGGSDPYAMIWGGFDELAWQYVGGGRLRGDGGLETSGHSNIGLTSLKTQSHAVSSTTSYGWDVDVYPRLVLNVDTDALTATLTLPAGYSPTEGDQIEVLVNYVNGAVTTFTLVWPSGGSAEFFFSSTGDKTPTQGANARTVYRGTYATTGVAAGFMMTKTAFPLGGLSCP